MRFKTKRIKLEKTKLPCSSFSLPFAASASFLALSLNLSALSFAAPLTLAFSSRAWDALPYLSSRSFTSFQRKNNSMKWNPVSLDIKWLTLNKNS